MHGAAKAFFAPQVACARDQQAFAGRSTKLRESREAEERQRTLEQKLAQERELEAKRERECLSHDKGYGEDASFATRQT